MKVVILAGGRGTRMGGNEPKALVHIGGHTLLWHVMRIYAAQGHRDFVIAGGHMYDEIFNWVQMAQSVNDISWLNTVTVVDTGLDTGTGGRVRLLADRGLVGYESFMATYVDGLANIDLKALLKRHRQAKTLATITAVRPRSQFGIIDISSDGFVEGFREKPILDYCNGGFFVLEPGVVDLLKPKSALERDAFPELAARRELAVYEHNGYWRQCDNPRDVTELEETWTADRPWAVWEKAKERAKR